MNLHDKINKITEVGDSHIKCNHNILDCYNCLSPFVLSKLSFSIFSRVVSNKIYYKKQDSHIDEKERQKETKRIYNTLNINAEFLLRQINPEKYIESNNTLSADIGNLSRRLHAISDNNIFYIWRYGTPTHYVFFMERDISVWKYFNPEAFVPVKSILKVLHNSKHAIEDTIKNAKVQNLGMSNFEIENSYVLFLNDFFRRASGQAVSKLLSCNDGSTVYNYINNATELIRSKEVMDTEFKIDDNFMNRIPYSIRCELGGGDSHILDKKSISDILSDISPKDDGGLIRKKEKTRVRAIISENIEPDFGTFENSDPLKNPNSLFNFYRGYLRGMNKNAQFYSITHQRNYASVVLDSMKDDGKDKKFLISWINYFYNKNLGGSKSQNKDLTSMKEFLSTYSEYLERSFA
jgi:hypothetical protein